MKRITAAYLRKLGACESQVETFEKLWPRGATINLRNIHRANAAGLDILWLLQKVLSPRIYADYEAKRAPLDADYETKRAPLILSALRAMGGGK